MTFKKDNRNRIRFTSNGFRFEVKRLADNFVTINVFERQDGRESKIDISEMHISPSDATKLTAALAAV